jgi:hypothetical protein
MSTIRYEIGNTVNFTSPDIQPDLANTFPHIFGNKDFEFFVTFFTNIGLVDSPASDVFVQSAPSYVTIEGVSPSTIKISKVANTSLFEEGFAFTDPETQTQETVNITEVLDYNIDNNLMIAWETPPDETANSNAVEVGTYEFIINNTNNVISYTQDYFWSPDEGFGIFEDILADI